MYWCIVMNYFNSDLCHLFLSGICYTCRNAAPTKKPKEEHDECSTPSQSQGTASNWSDTQSAASKRSDIGRWEDIDEVNIPQVMQVFLFIIFVLNKDIQLPILYFYMHPLVYTCTDIFFQIYKSICLWYNQITITVYISFPFFPRN